MLLTTILGLCVLGQTALPGDAMTLEDARAKATLIVVSKPGKSLIMGVGASSFGQIDLKPSSVLKGRMEGDVLERVSVSLSGREEVPRGGEDFIFFIHPYQGHPSIIKALPATPGNIAAVKEEPRSGGKP